MLKAPREKVWEAITTREGWNGWFTKDVRGEFRVGETLTLDFGEHGVGEAIVTEREEFRVLAIKGHPGECCKNDKYPEAQMTTSRFTLEDHPQGTKLTLVEFGFENVPEERRQKCVDGNTEGWTVVAAWLQDYMEQGKKRPPFEG